MPLLPRADAWRFRVAWIVACLAVLFLFTPQPLTAQAEDGLLTYTVQAGDTLADLADRFGVPLLGLMKVNGIQHPRWIYPGQTLRIVLPAVPHAEAWVRTMVAWPDTASSLARRAGVGWGALGLRNRVLAPNAIVPGTVLMLPPLAASALITPPVASAPRIAAAVGCRAAIVELLSLNAQPLRVGELVLIPARCAPATLAVRIEVAPQPVTRGKTAWFVLEGLEPGACEATWAAVTEPCYRDAEGRYVGLFGISPLLDPGPYSLEIRWASASESARWVLPLRVAAGVYDYERIDLPPGRQELLDPTLSEAERASIARLRPLRTAERLWELPFRWPLEGAVTSYFGSRRSYGYGFGSFHAGSDFDAETGAPVLAPASGVVVLAERLVVRGNAIVIDHGWGILSGYWHLSRIDVAVGQAVAQGQVIGAVGDTGLSTGPHLHWELWVNGVAVDPLPWVYAPPSVSGGLP